MIKINLLKWQSLEGHRFDYVYDCYWELGNFKDTAKALGCCVKTVKKYLGKCGVEGSW